MPDTPTEKQLLLLSGISGLGSALFYIAAITLPLNVQGSFFVATMWPIISIVFLLAMYRMIARERPGIVLQLAFLFSIIGFAMVASMLAIQLAVGQGFTEYGGKATGFSTESWSVLRRSLRMVDLGLDVAWDMFIGSGLTLLGISMLRHSRFGFLWGIVATTLGILLMVLNVATFPWPPNTRGLFDLGPFIGIYLAFLSIWMLVQGLRVAGEMPAK